MTVAYGVDSIRAARRYRWRLAGGRLIASGASLRFAPNRLERRRADTYWECRAEDVIGVRVRGKMWLVVETASASETFRVFGAAAVAPRLNETLHPTTHRPISSSPTTGWCRGASSNPTADIPSSSTTA